MTETGARGSRPGELHRRRVVLVAESAGLAAVLSHLLDPADRLSRIGSPRELAESRSLDTADVVVLDVPVEDRAATLGQVRRRYLGPLVVLVARGDRARGLVPDDDCTLLARPFSTEQLGAALAVPGRSPSTGTAPAAPSRTPPPAADLGPPGTAPVRPPGAWFDAPGAVSPTGRPGSPAGAGRPMGTPVAPTGFGTRVADPKAAARKAPVRRAPAAALDRPGPVERLQRLLVALTQGWQAKRRVRVAGFSAFALVAFTVAFVLAAQGGRCGPGCDAFGTGFSPAPTTAPSESSVPPTTGPKRAPTTTAAPAGDGAFRGIAGGRGVATTSKRQATTTTGRPGGGAVTTRPATTRPATTQTTAPTTTDTTATTLPTTTQTTTGP